jgi:hypothetical protein
MILSGRMRPRLGDVSVANTSYASSEECYADGMKRARGRIVVCIEGKQGQ